MGRRAIDPTANAGGTRWPWRGWASWLLPGGRSQLKTAAARVEDRLSDQMLHDSIVSTASTYSKRAGVIRPFGGRKKNSRCHHWTGAHRLISVSSVPMLYTYPSKNKDARMQMQILCTVGT